MGLGQATFNPIWPPSLPLRADTQKSSLQGASRFSLGTGNHSSYLGSNPGSHPETLLFWVFLCQGGIKTPASTPGAQAGSGLSSTQRQSPGDAIQMGLSRLRAGDKPLGRPVKTHTNPHKPAPRPSPWRAALTAGTEVITSQEAEKTHINATP